MAIPPCSNQIRASRVPAAQSSGVCAIATGHAYPCPLGAATATSPPRLTRTGAPMASDTPAATRSAAYALPVAPRSRRTPFGNRTRLPSTSMARQSSSPAPRTIVAASSVKCARWPLRPAPAPALAPTPAKGISLGAPCPRAATISKVRSYPAATIAGSRVGSTRPQVDSAASRATAVAPARTSLTVTQSPERALSRRSSESARNLLHPWSTAARIARATPSASASVSPRAGSPLSAIAR